MIAAQRLKTWGARPLPFFVAVAVAVLFCAGVERLIARWLEPERGACWIWADGDYGGGEPIAFYAVREVELPAPGPGRITVAADETYLLYLNGRLVGSGSYRPEAPFDIYEVGDLLDAGINRVVIELRSSRGAGGLLAELELGGTAVVTDESWRVFRRHDARLVRGWSMLEGGEPPKVWARAPTGRWRLDGIRKRPILFDVFPPPERRRPARHQRYNSGSWSELDASRRRIPAIGPQRIFDWGEPVEGYLSFNFRSVEGRPGLLYVSDQRPDPRNRPPDAVIVPVPGRRHWQDAHPRRFRYALLVGVEPDTRIEVLRQAPDTETASNNRHGVFGIEPPRSYLEAEKRVWNRLENEGR